MDLEEEVKKEEDVVSVEENKESTDPSPGKKLEINNSEDVFNSRRSDPDSLKNS